MIRISIGGVPEHFNLPWHRLLASSLPAAKGIDARWQDFPDGTGAMVEALNAGRLDVALLLTEGAAAGVAGGGRYEVLSLYTQSPLIWGLHVASGSRLQTPDELGRARFAISRFGSGSHLMAVALAQQEGRSVEGLRFVVVGGLDGAVASFRRGESDVFLWEKFMTQPVVDRGDFRRVGEFVAPWPAFVVCASRDALADRREAIGWLVDVVGRQAADLHAAPDAAALIAARYGLDEAAAAEWLSLTQWARGMTAPDAAIAAARAVLEAAGVIESGAAKQQGQQKRSEG